MFAVSVTLTRLSVKFVPDISKRVWEHVQVLVVGALLAPGKRTVTAMLRVVRLSQERHFQNYYWVLNRARIRMLPYFPVCSGTPSKLRQTGTRNDTMS